MFILKNKSKNAASKECCAMCGEEIYQLSAESKTNSTKIHLRKKKQPTAFKASSFNLSPSLFIFACIGVFLVSFAKATPSKKLTVENSVAVDASVFHLDESSRKLEKNNYFQPQKNFEAVFGSSFGESSLLRIKRSRRKRCSKHLRRNFCMNKGSCRWIAAMRKASCECKKGWRGERCEKPWIELSTNTEQPPKKHDSTITIALVLTGFGMLVLMVAIFFCWRRYKSIKKHLQTGNSGLEKQSILTGKPSSSSLINSSIE